MEIWCNIQVIINLLQNIKFILCRNHVQGVLLMIHLRIIGCWHFSLFWVWLCYSTSLPEYLAGLGSRASAECKSPCNLHIIISKFSWMSQPVTKQTSNLQNYIFCIQASLNLRLMRGCRALVFSQGRGYLP